MKEEMKAARSNALAESRIIRKHIREAVKEDEGARVVGELRKELARLEEVAHFHMVRYTPVRFSNGCILNGTFLKQFVRKLPKKNFPLSATFTDDNKNLEFAHKSGKITLYDLSRHYGNMVLPKGEDLLEELGISI